jgi:hypothetical protein
MHVSGRAIRLGITALGATGLLAIGVAAGYVASAPAKYNACATKKDALTLLTSKGKCPSGSHKVTLGASGPKGDAGSAGPFPSTLPSGKTITGTFAGTSDAPSQAIMSAGFVYPLSAPLDAAHAPVINGSGANADPVHCSGSVTAPTATPGYFCLYAGVKNNVASVTPYVIAGVTAGTSTAGALLSAIPSGGTMTVTGAWALTAP